jgi:hypothetical protein
MCDVNGAERVFRKMRPWMLGTDWLLLAYWFFTGLVALGLLSIPEGYLFKDYYDPRVIAWNWSFFPLDVIFAVLGIYSARLFAKGDARWFGYALVSAALTFCAGFMAVSYWAILGDFDPSWWTPNLIIAIWPVWFIPNLITAKS